MLVLIDDSEFIYLPASKDNKIKFEGDKGRNIGGLGAYATASVYTEAVCKKQ